MPDTALACERLPDGHFLTGLAVTAGAVVVLMLVTWLIGRGRSAAST